MLKNIQIKPLLLFVLLSLFYITYFLFYAQSPVDDSYIHMRIARNFLNYGAPFYNNLEPILASSSHTWILLLTVFFIFTGGTVNTVIALEIIIFLIFFGVLVKLFRLKFSTYIAIFLAFIGISFIHNFSTTSLMETQLASLFITLHIYFAFRSKTLLSTLFLTFAVFTRNEFVILWILNLFYYRKSKEFYLGSAIVLIPFLIYLFAYYGTIIPQPMLAKKLMKSSDQFFNFGSFLLDDSYQYFFNAALLKSLLLSKKILSYLGLISIGLGLAFLLRKLTKEEIHLKMLLIFTFALLLIYTLSGNLIFFWYWPNIMFPLFLVFIFKIESKYFKWLSTLFISRIILLIFSLIGFLTLNKSFHSTYNQNDRIKAYLPALNYLNNLDSRPKVASFEAGIIGWEYQEEIIDLMGLVSKKTFEILQQNPHNLFKSYIDSIKITKPDYVLTFDIPFMNLLLKNLNSANIKSSIVKTTPLKHSYFQAKNVILIKLDYPIK